MTCLNKLFIFAQLFPFKFVTLLLISVLLRMEQIKKVTGNIINDIDLNGHHYDFKICYDESYNVYTKYRKSFYF